MTEEYSIIIDDVIRGMSQKYNNWLEEATFEKEKDFVIHLSEDMSHICNIFCIKI